MVIFVVAALAAAASAALVWLMTARRMGDVFARASQEALDRNARAFLEMAGGRLAQQQEVARGDLDRRQQAVSSLVAPLQDSLARMEAHIAGVERARSEAYAGLMTQVRGLADSQDRLRSETSQLVGALRSPQARGRWGEVQLRRVVELAGMVKHCDFVEQQTVTRAGTVRRPDMLVVLPGHHRLAVDAKVPLTAYLQAHGSSDPDERDMLLRDHARALKGHVNALADKAYWDQFPDAPDFVVLFIPGEAFLAAAFDQEPELFEYAYSRRVLLASPTTLIALLQSIAVGWRHESVAEDAKEVVELGRELYKRLASMGEHIAGVGKALDKAVEAHNRAVGSLEARVLVTARKLAAVEFGDGDGLAVLEPVERATRALQAEELTRLKHVEGDSVA